MANHRGPTSGSVALSTSHADLITSLSFSLSSPSLLASTSLDGWIRIHARTTTTATGTATPSAAPGPSGGSSRRTNRTKSQRHHLTSGANTAVTARVGSRQRPGHAAGAYTDESMTGDEDEGADEAGGEDDGAEEERDEWVEVGSVKANEGPVWRAAWAPREYGTTLLVSIAGSVVNVWETQIQQGGSSKITITPRATLVEARGSLRDVAFAPSEFGMKLASIAADSHLRVYECLDPSPAGLASWSLLEDIDLLALPDGYYSSAAANHPQSTHHHQAQTQLIKGFDDSSRALGAAGGSSGSLGAQSGSSNSDGNTAGRPNGAVGRIESTGAWALAYCQEAWWGEVAAVSAGKDGSIRIIHFAPPSYWSQLAVLTPPSGHSSPVATLAWAPSCGRSYHLIASGARDGVVRIHKLVPPAEGTAGREWQTSLVAEITDHVEGSGGGGGGVGRVEWNVTGTVLSTAGCDGRVRLWKAGYSGEWRVMSTISCEGKSGDGSQPQSHHQRR